MSKFKFDLEIIVANEAITKEVTPITSLRQLDLTSLPHTYYLKDASALAVIRVLDSGTAKAYYTTLDYLETNVKEEKILSSQIGKKGVYIYDSESKEVIFNMEDPNFGWESTALWGYKPPINIYPDDNAFLMWGGDNDLFLTHALSPIPRICFGISELNGLHKTFGELSQFGVGMTINALLQQKDLDPVMVKDVFEGKHLIKPYRDIPNLPGNSYKSLLELLSTKNADDEETDDQEIFDSVEVLSEILSKLRTDPEYFENKRIKVDTDFKVPFEFSDMIVSEGSFLVFTGDTKVTKEVVRKSFDIPESMAHIVIIAD